MSKTKKITLAVSTLAMLVVIALAYNTELGLCSEYTRCVSNLGYLFSNLLIIPPVFIFSVLFLFAKDEVYKHWAIFSAVWSIVTVLLTSISDNRPGSFVFPSMSGMVELLMIALYIAISIILVAYKSWRLRGE